MNSARRRVIGAMALGLFAEIAHAQDAQDVSRYRDYVLESSLASVVGASGARMEDAKTIHARPAKIQELVWRAPYVGAGSERPDPVRQIAFTFYNDALYQIIVSYDGVRTDGLTNADVVETLSAAYGSPRLSSAKTPLVPPAAADADSIVLAQWETAAASLSLVRDAYMPAFQLILISKPLSLRARTAAREAIRLDAAEAPQRESDERKRDAAAALAGREKARATNKPAFRP